MKTFDDITPDDMTPDERDEENQRVLQHVRRLYPPHAFVEQRLAGVQRRLASAIHADAQEQGKAAHAQHRPGIRIKTMEIAGLSFPGDRRPPWRRRLATVAAGLCAVLLVGAFLLLLNLAHHVGTNAIIQSGQQITMLTSLHMLDASNGWALTGKALLRTSDGGSHWKDVTPAGAHVTPNSASTSLSALQAWIAIPAAVSPTSIPPGLRIYRTSDGGQSWQGSMVAFNQGGLKLAQMTFATAQNGWLLFNQGGIGGAERAVVARTTDGGKSWAVVSSVLPASTDMPPPGRLPYGGTKTGIVFRDAATGWITGSDSVQSIAWLFVTRDGGQTWSQQALSLPPGVAAASLSLQPPTFFSTSEGVLPVGVGDAATVIYVTRDGGASWEPTTPLSVHAGAVDFLDGQHGWVTDGTALFATSDGGHSWSKQSTSSAFTHVTQLDFVSSTHGWAVSSAGFLLQTVDGGRTWA